MNFKSKWQEARRFEKTRFLERKYLSTKMEPDRREVYDLYRSTIARLCDLAIGYFSEGKREPLIVY
jgi:hypothetical protein